MRNKQLTIKGLIVIVLAVAGLALVNCGTGAVDNSTEGIGRASALGDYCGETAGTYGDGSAGAAFTAQQIDDTLNWLNAAEQATIDACTYIDSTEAAALYAGKPYHAIGTIGTDEGTLGNGHIDGIAGISEAASDNDLLALRNCATPVTQSCDNVCGNTLVGAGEDCDAGAETANCDANCTFVSCGDGDLNMTAGESCDDGNTTSGDGCSSTCKEEFSYEIWFANNYEYGTEDPTCDNGQRPMCHDLKDLLATATESIDFAIYGYSLNIDQVAAVIKNRQDNGVVVRGIVDVQNSTFCRQSSQCGGEGQPLCATYSYSNTQAFVDEFSAGTVRCDNGPGSSYIMHHKFFVIDGYKVWAGTTNVSQNCIGSEGNANTGFQVNSWRVAQAYIKEIDDMWTDDGDGAGDAHNEKDDNSAGLLENWADGSTVVKQYFSPNGAFQSLAILPAIASATDTIDIQMFYFTDQAVADALLAAHARGVDVRMILDAGSDVGLYDRASCKSCDGDPSSPNFNPLSVEVGMNFLCDVLNTDPSKGPLMIVKTEPWSGKQHNKTAVIDAGVSGGGKSIIGSQNWTGSGEENNDENSFYVKHDALAAEMQADFNSKWNSQLIQDVTPCSYVAQEGNTSSDCTNGNCKTQCITGTCCDTKDNDWDGNTDSADTGCYDYSIPVEDSQSECTDGVDNDGDSNVDAQDFGCWPTLGLAYEVTLAACSDDADNDGDGFADEKDYDCFAILGMSKENSLALCTDDIDNDADGNKDGGDQNCTGMVGVSPTIGEGGAVWCLDGVDNDGDGYTDGTDTNCGGAGAEDTSAECNNSTDDDSDNLVDGNDIGCAGKTGLTKETGGSGTTSGKYTCVDGVDNDGDGKRDARDPDCVTGTNTGGGKKG